MDTTQKLALYTEAKDAYYNTGTPLMSDAEFDALELDLIDSGALTMTKVGAPERAGKVALPTPMGSLDQLRTNAEILRWTSKYPGEVIVISEKIDGNSLLLQYKSGVLVGSFSRGDGLRGANNLRHSQHITSVITKLPFQYTGTIRGEVVVAKADWSTIQSIAAASGKVYANSRNFVAGFMNASESDLAIYKYLTFVAYQVTPSHSTPLDKLDQFALLQRGGFTIPTVVQYVAHAVNENRLIELTKNMITQSRYELDGCVAEINSSRFHSIPTDPTNLNPPHGRKFKVISDAASAVTTVTHVEWNISKHGLLKPLIHFTPISLDGATITKATGHNARMMQDKQIGEGAVIRIARSGGVIPKLVDVINPGNFVLPPDCTWNGAGVELVSATASSPTEEIEKLAYFFQKLEVDGASIGAAEKLHSAGLTTWIAVVTAPQETYTQVIGKANGAKIFKNLHAALDEVLFAKFAAACCVFDRGIGERKLTDVINQLKLTDHYQVLLQPRSAFLELDGIQATSADKLVAGLAELHKQLKTLENASSTKISFTRSVPVKSVTSGALINQVICTTGVRLSPEQKDSIVALGGEVTDTLSTAVTILVAKDPDSTSAKIVKARSRGVTVMSLADFVAKL
jgi:NAD-dependent DNA ligase